MRDISFPFRRRGLPSPHLLATRLHMCSPETAFRLYSTIEMRHWCQQQPGILFPFGWLRFPGELPRHYVGGLVTGAVLFLFVPSWLYERHRRLLMTPWTPRCSVRSTVEKHAEHRWGISDDAICQQDACAAGTVLDIVPRNSPGAPYSRLALVVSGLSCRLNLHLAA